MHLDHVKSVGISAAYRGSEILRARLGNISKVTKKSKIDLVTEADAESEEAIIETIRNAFPDHGILAEESGGYQEKADCRWIIDPLDGTTNFAHQLGLFSVSIAFAFKGIVKVGIVQVPMSGELFWAVAGKGAALNGRPIRVSNSGKVSESLLVTGFPYNFKDMLNPLMRRFSNCLSASRGVRRLGSAALDLCYVACGRFEAFWEQNLEPWDTAAGMLIVREAGGRVTDFFDRPFRPDKSEILASNDKIHAEMLSLLNLEDTECEKIR